MQYLFNFIFIAVILSSCTKKGDTDLNINNAINNAHPLIEKIEEYKKQYGKYPLGSRVVDCIDKKGEITAYSTCSYSRVPNDLRFLKKIKLSDEDFLAPDISSGDLGYEYRPYCDNKKYRISFWVEALHNQSSFFSGFDPDSLKRKRIIVYFNEQQDRENYSQYDEGQISGWSYIKDWYDVLEEIDKDCLKME